MACESRIQEIIQLTPPPTLPTAFGCLRPWRADDLPALVKYANNRKIWLNLRDGFPHPYTEENGRAFIQVAAQRPAFFAIATPEEAVGSIGLSINEDVHRLTAEMGYWLAEPYWGKGMMSEAVTRITEYAFESLGLVRIYAEPYAHNTASRKVLEKAGYTLEGRLRKNAIKDGQIIDMFLYAKVKE